MSSRHQKFYITTPIYYVNGLPHIGAAYTSIAADILARYHRLRGEEVRFLMGTDENAQKNVEAAFVRHSERSGSVVKNPVHHGAGSFAEAQDDSVRGIVQSYVDAMSARWKETWDELELTNDDFIRTTEKRHIEFVEKFWGMVKKGDIYKGKYTGLYCTGCEAYKTETDLVNGKCPDHQRAPKKLSEENYFFKLSAYREKLLAHIKKHPEFVQPEARRNEIISYIKDHAKDFSISRENLEWGIPVPGDPTQTIYVWFDALLNYISANKKKWWPADLHLVGKDIIKFHCVYWPAMLMSAGLPLPKAVFAHGFFTVDGEKMSKTIGNVVDPVTITRKYGNDVLRYYLMREIPFGGDGDFSETRLRARYNGELANGIGNLVARVLTMVEKYCDGRVPSPGLRPPSPTGRGEGEGWWLEYQTSMDTFALDRALAVIWDYAASCDKYIDETQPWKLAKSSPEAIPGVLYILAESLRHIAWMLLPFMPDTAQKIFEQLGIPRETSNRNYAEAVQWGGLKAGIKVKRGEALFPRLI